MSGSHSYQLPLSSLHCNCLELLAETVNEASAAWVSLPFSGPEMKVSGRSFGDVAR